MTRSTRPRAGELMLEAARTRAEAETCENTHPIPSALNHADEQEAQARTALPESMAAVGTGRELVPVDEHGYSPNPVARSMSIGQFDLTNNPRANLPYCQIRY